MFYPEHQLRADVIEELDMWSTGRPLKSFKHVAAERDSCLDIRRAGKSSLEYLDIMFDDPIPLCFDAACRRSERIVLTLISLEFSPCDTSKRSLDVQRCWYTWAPTKGMC